MFLCVSSLLRSSYFQGVVVNFDLGERFPRPRSQQRQNLRPPHGARRLAVLGVCAGGPGVTPGNFFLRFLMPNSAFVGNFGQKIN